MFDKTVTIWKAEYVPPELLREVVGKCQNVMGYYVQLLARYYKNQLILRYKLKKIESQELYLVENDVYFRILK